LTGYSPRRSVIATTILRILFFFDDVRHPRRFAEDGSDFPCRDTVCRSVDPDEPSEVESEPLPVLDFPPDHSRNFSRPDDKDLLMVRKTGNVHLEQDTPDQQGSRGDQNAEVIRFSRDTEFGDGI